MSIKDKLEVINYICNHCQEGFQTASFCREPNGNHNLKMNIEDRFERCSVLRARVFKIDRLFNRTIFNKKNGKQHLILNNNDT